MNKKLQYCENVKCGKRFRIQAFYEEHKENYEKYGFCSDRRQIGTPLTNKEYKEIEKHIKENNYKSISHFLKVAIKNELKNGGSKFTSLE